eukprot:1038581-Amphidinium_carterae.1
MSKAGIHMRTCLMTMDTSPLWTKKGVLQSRSRTPPASGCAFSPACFPHGQRPHVRHGFQNIHAESP